MADGNPHSSCNHAPQGEPQLDEAPLTAAELKELRELMEADRRVKWLWAVIRRTVIWVGAVGGSIAVGWDVLVKVVLHSVGK